MILPLHVVDAERSIATPRCNNQLDYGFGTFPVVPQRITLGDANEPVPATAVHGDRHQMRCASHEPRVVCLPRRWFVLLNFTRRSQPTPQSLSDNEPTSRARKGSQETHRPTCGFGLNQSLNVSFDCIDVEESFHGVCNSGACPNDDKPD